MKPAAHFHGKCSPVHDAPHVPPSRLGTSHVPPTPPRDPSPSWVACPADKINLVLLPLLGAGTLLGLLGYIDTYHVSSPCQQGATSAAAASSSLG